jgi:hypothetical protein
MKEEEIKAILDDMDADIVREAFALLLAERKNCPPAMDIPDFVNFAQALLFLKKNYNFAELDLFSTEADLAYVTAGGRRILLSDFSVAAAKPPRRERETPADGGGGNLNADSSADEGFWRDAAVRDSPPAESRFSRLEL